jgi:UDP-N-acetylmuramyl pentapeptide phosphotransferase/UDP-N-acetylglucosamine-1-phosphate transferase/glycosyltransferase involved in cell wall biosynthesis
MFSLILLGVASFLLALILTPVVRNLFRRWGLVDHPDSARKLHKRPVPSGGGVAVALAYVLSYVVLLSLPLHGGSIVKDGLPLTWRLLPSAILVLAVGFLDDILGLRPWQKLLGQVAAAGGAFWAGIHLSSLAGYPIGIGWSLPLTIGWLIFCTNALNLIDGVDGLATGLGLFAAATTLTAALLQSNVPLALAAAPLVGALLGFLRYNFNPATVFLGDSGSLFLGFLLGCYGVLWSQKSTTVLGMTAPLLVLFIPLLDTALVIVRRFLRRQPIFTADRSHIHHCLLERGFTPRRVALSLYAACVVGAVCSIAIMQARFSGIVIVFFGLFVAIGVWHLAYAEFGTAARMFIEGAFRRQLNSRIALHGLEERLAAAETPQDCWTTIQSAAPDFGLHGIRMSLGEHTFSERNGSQFARYWSVHIPLSDNDHLELTHAFGGTVQADATAPFVAVVRKALTPKLAGFHGLAPKYRTPVPDRDTSPVPAQSCVFINQFFWPDPAATSQLLTDVAAWAVEEGHTVRVIAGATKYTESEDLIPPPVRVDRCPAFPFNRGILGRIASYLSFLIVAVVHAFRGPRPDTVVTLTTPPALGLIGCLVRAVRGSRHYIWEMDLYPDIAVDMGVLAPRSPLTRIVGWAFDFARNRADGIIALGDEVKDRLIAHGIPAEKIHVCENWADGRDITPLPFPKGPLTLYYSGNLGIVHEVDTILDAIEHFRNDGRFRFLFAGGGSRRAGFEALCRERSFDNVLFGPYCDRADLGARLAQGHIGLVTQLPESLGSVVPSKTYGIMAAGRPILFIGPGQATPARIVEKHRCGWHIEPGDTRGLIQLLETLAHRPDLIRGAGDCARRAFEQHYDRPIAVARLNAILGLPTSVQAPLTKPIDVPLHALRATAAE